ncbi:hypothetical protein PHPALM_29822 [Phytophthora palmivora]|uniref:Uncharacterized protein n=1 Tax=Phytophthora palmivora TaxID=4796 RepID=A0A2P4X6N0_9STRA|nr:hypothetical protein PHPALM_29822 [Phytophthora palmivora]
METSDSSPQFVSVTTPSGTKAMSLAPFDKISSKPASECRQNKRKADAMISETWLKNLERRGGFWGDAYWFWTFVQAVDELQLLF